MSRFAHLIPLLALVVVPTGIGADPPQVAFTEVGAGSAIVRLDQSGAGVVELTRGKPEPLAFDAFSWSPDGARLVYAGAGLVGGNLHAIDANGGSLAQLTTGAGNQAPAWSPDGTWIAFSSNRDHLDDEGRHHFDSEIYVIEPDGANPQRLTVSKTANRTPAWSPNSRSIVYYSSDGANQAVIHVLDLAEALKNPVPQAYDLTDGSAYESDPAWSPDGQWIVFISTRQGEQDGGINRTAVYRMRIDGGDMQRLTTSNLWPREQPSWSPDGQWLAFSVQNDIASGTGFYDLYIMQLDGSGLRCLTCSSSK